MKERVIAIGGFDLYNNLHAEFLKQAAALGDELYVGVFSDRLIKYRTGLGHPVYSLDERLSLVRSNKHVTMVAPLPGANSNQMLKGLQGLLGFWKPNTFAHSNDRDLNSWVTSLDDTHPFTSTFLFAYDLSSKPVLRRIEKRHLIF